MANGLNYFGYKDLEFLAIGWTTAKQSVAHLLNGANEQADNINTLLKYINDNDVRMVVNEQFISSVLAPPRNKLNETNRRITFEQQLKRKSVQVRTIECIFAKFSFIMSVYTH